MHTFGRFLLSLVFFSSAGALGEFFGGKDPLLFTGANEAEVKREIQRVAEWSKKRGWSDGSLPAITLNAQTKQYEANLKVLLPGEVGGFTMGQNCHGNTLFSAGILPGFRIVGETELPFWLGSPLCKPIVRPDLPAPGDVVRIRGLPTESQLHTFIYFSDKLVYEKYGTESEINVKSKADAMAPYKVSPDCDGVLEVPVDCKVATNYFRCRSLDEYLKEAGDKVSPEARAIHARLEAIENALTRAHSFGGPFPDKFHDSLKELGAHATAKLAALKKARPLEKSDPERFVWEGIRLRSLESGSFASTYHKQGGQTH